MEPNLQNNYDSWKNVYMEPKNWIKKTRKKIVHNFNPFKKIDIEWDNLESQFKEYTRIHQTNGWGKLFLNKIIDNANNPHKNVLFTNTKKN